VAGELVHRTAEPRDVPALIRCAIAGIGLYREAFSTRGTAPTKVGEMLACGLPIASNAVGDIARVLDGSGAGVIVQDLTDEDLARSAAELSGLERDPDVVARTRALAEKWFSLDRGVDAYETIYKALYRGEARTLGDATWPPSPAAPSMEA